MGRLERQSPVGFVSNKIHSSILLGLLQARISKCLQRQRFWRVYVIALYRGTGRSSVSPFVFCLTKVLVFYPFISFFISDLHTFTLSNFTRLDGTSPPSRCLLSHFVGFVMDEYEEFVDLRNFHSYLCGQPVPSIGNKGEEILEAIRTNLHESLSRSVSRVREVSQSTSTNSGRKRKRDDDAIGLIRNVMTPIFNRLELKSVAGVEGGEGGAVDELCLKWFLEFSNRQLLRAPRAQSKKRQAPRQHEISDDSDVDSMI